MRRCKAPSGMDLGFGKLLPRLEAGPHRSLIQATGIRKKSAFFLEWALKRTARALFLLGNTGLR